MAPASLARTVLVAAGMAAVSVALPARGDGAAPDEAVEGLTATEELGRRLFFDTVLSRRGNVACATCHRPEHGFADPRSRSIGDRGEKTARHAPTLVNRRGGAAFFWDGRAATLEDQVLQPIANEREMDLPLGEALARLAADDGYRAAFDAAFERAPDEEALASALAAFVRTLVAGESRVDRFHAGDRSALTRAERTGMWLFESRAGCWRCHGGTNLTDEAFHNTGVAARSAGADGERDPGRFAVTGDEADRGAFKTPTLRGVALTAPYMHDGSLATLEDVVEHYRAGGRAGSVDDPNLDPHVVPLELSDEEAASLVAFLRALTPAG